MVSQINLGSFFSFGGKTVAGGASSGLDTESLVKALTDAKLLPVKDLEDKIEVNNEKVTALGEFKTLFGKLKDAVNILRNPPGVGNAADNAFKYRTANITSNTAVAGSNYVSVTASPGAALQSYKIEDITSIAKAKKQSTGNISIASADAAAVSATPAAGQFRGGTFTLNGESITLVNGESLNSVAAKFNAVSDDTGISASIIKVATGQYQLSFSATETGEDADFDFNNVTVPGTLVDASGVFSSVTITDKQAAANAEFKFNGVDIVRQTNTISDLVDNVSITLKQDTNAAPTTEIDVDIVADKTISKNTIINFVNLYNELKIFAAKHAEVGDDGLYKDTAVLNDNSLLKNTMSSLGSYLASVVDGISGSNPNKLADLGLSFIDQEATEETPFVRNLISVDDNKLTAAIDADADAVRKVFEFDFVTNNTSLRVVSRTNALKETDFSLNINPGTSTFEATYTDGTGSHTIDMDATAVRNSSGTITGYTLKGQAGTVLEGLVLVYTSTATGTANVTATQGIADKIYNLADTVLKTNTGTLALELDSIKSAEERLQDDIDDINEQVEAYRQQLLDKFARLEQAIANVNTLLASIEANDNARNGINS